MYNNNRSRRIGTKNVLFKEKIDQKKVSASHNKQLAYANLERYTTDKAKNDWIIQKGLDTN